MQLAALFLVASLQLLSAFAVMKRFLCFAAPLPFWSMQLAAMFPVALLVVMKLVAPLQFLKRRCLYEAPLSSGAPLPPVSCSRYEAPLLLMQPAAPLLFWSMQLAAMFQFLQRRCSYEAPLLLMQPAAPLPLWSVAYVLQRLIL